LRFFGSELRLVFRRPRNLALLGVIAVVPIFFGVVLRLTLHNPTGGGGNGPEFVNQLAGNGVFLALVVLFLTETLLRLSLARPAWARCGACWPSRRVAPGCSWSSTRRSPPTAPPCVCW
jgi:hypothetical protein